MIQTAESLLEFAPKTYGRQFTGLFILRSIGIWSLASIPLMLESGAMIWHGKPFSPISWSAIVGVLCLAALFQWLAAVAWRKPDLRRADWNPRTQVLTVSHHRFTRHFFSLGVLEEQIEVAISDILSVKLVRGRGQQLHLHTRHGFVCLTNDLQPFEQLQALVSGFEKSE